MDCHRNRSSITDVHQRRAMKSGHTPDAGMRQHAWTTFLWPQRGILAATGGIDGAWNAPIHNVADSGSRSSWSDLIALHLLACAADDVESGSPRYPCTLPRRDVQKNI